MATLYYKGYKGEATWEDNNFVIQVLEIDDFITANCDQAQDVVATFKRLIEDYTITKVKHKS